MSGELEAVLQLLVAGLTVGCIYGLMCVGLGLIFGVMRVINFAQGDFMMVGMYLAFLMVGAAVTLPVNPYLTAVLAAIAAGVILFFVSSGLHLMMIRAVSGQRVSDTDDGGHTRQLILTLGISLVLQNAALMVFGSTPKSIRTPFSTQAWEIGPLIGDDVFLFFNKARVLSALAACVIALGLALFMGRSAIGRRLRAAADNPTASIYMGIDVDAAHRMAFGLGIALTAIAGALIAVSVPFQPYSGLEYVVLMYAGVVLGGMGSVAGAFWGGLIIGFVQQMSQLVMPVQLQATAVFTVFLLILLFRPQGLFGRNVERA
ncbi:branched-chain amino acid ABC transporter permease [Bosea sp. (in: a-proteobacteria)]|uniref:branched-chain amino acid ABC transporter permease n=1 Tax=Bosea sp. (in: a-proteobacteria) TaxID=1871050 RepID=UPI002616A84D|nr:branched-chain amino acid ABC transporter permease [Bosea sp. (in: a-proteobacteria)]MCO5091013.1 branched-chain amino acid ABC transporter permease [Bosea sp. (in: a-proteobacteria)]